MSTYVITGVARGIGWEFTAQLSENSENKVIGIVRDKDATEKKVMKELAGRKNVFILEADLEDYKSLKKAAEDSLAITGGKVDYLFSNAAYGGKEDGFTDIGTLGTNPEELISEFHKIMSINTLGTVHFYNLFIPQILAGRAKKCVLMTSGHPDIDVISNYDIVNAPLYSMSKAAANVVTAKFSAQYKEQGVLFVGLAPPAVDVGNLGNLTPAQQESLGKMFQKFVAYAPHFKGPVTPSEAVDDILRTIDDCSIEKGDGGKNWSHHKNKMWL